MHTLCIFLATLTLSPFVRFNHKISNYLHTLCIWFVSILISCAQWCVKKVVTFLFLFDMIFIHYEIFSPLMMPKKAALVGNIQYNIYMWSTFPIDFNQPTVKLHWPVQLIIHFFGVAKIFKAETMTDIHLNSFKFY